MTTKPSISAIIIAKNEQEVIEEAVSSLLPVCSRIVLIDTGSSDATPVLAASLGCEVYFKSWTNDFASARNYALNFVRSDWVISLDADEKLDLQSFTDNFYLLENENTGGIYCNLKNFLDESLQTYSEHKYSRIFRNHPNIKFAGAIHEQISPSIESSGFEIMDSEIIIEHFGYINSSEEKKLRNQSMITSEFEKNPNDDWLKYHLANTEFSLNNHAKAFELFSAVAKSDSLSREQIETSKLRLLQIALAGNDFEFLRQNEFIHFENPNFEGLRLFIMSAYYLTIKDFKSAFKAVDNNLTRSSSLVDKALLENSINILKNYK